ncbi:MAG TPA: DnaA/Hda family protein, partial [Candidatus Limnocylindria bacterium]|nr:DnaA/Hda family protein [Candidatus Limnocylindria bacterium]
MPDNDALRWDRVCRRLRAEIGEDVYTSWFTSVALEGVLNDCVRLSVPTRFLRNWIQSHYGERLLEICRAEFQEVQNIDLLVRTTLVRTSASPARASRNEKSESAPDRAVAMAPRPGSGGAPIDHTRLHGAGGSPLDPRFTYATFLVGRSNALAHAAARQVVEAQTGTAARFNPLYIHAAVGLGKTHLLQAIVWAGEASGRRMIYLTAEKFMYGFVAALKSQSAIAFKEALRGIE